MVFCLFFGLGVSLGGGGLGASSVRLGLDNWFRLWGLSRISFSWWL